MSFDLREKVSSVFPIQLQAIPIIRKEIPGKLRIFGEGPLSVSTNWYYFATSSNNMYREWFNLSVEIEH